MKKIIKNILFKKSAKGDSATDETVDPNLANGEHMIDDKKLEESEIAEQQSMSEDSEVDNSDSIENSTETDSELEKEVFDTAEDGDEPEDGDEARPMHLSVEDEDDFLRGSSEAETDTPDSEESDEEYDSAPSNYREQNERQRKSSNAHELLTEEVPFRVQRANDRLKSNLAGSIIFEVDSKQKYLFDWNASKLKVEETEESQADCLIKISEQNLMKVASGELNPQVAMLSDKIDVTGRLGLAIYIFNLIAPRQFMH